MNHKSVHVIQHPILEHKMAIIRNKNTHSQEFRNVFTELSQILAYECTRDLKLHSVEIETPIEKTTAKKVAEDIVIMSVLRAAEGMVPGFLQVLPFARLGHIGIYRDKLMNQTVEYYFKLPANAASKRTFILDPMLASGDTILASLDRLKQYQVGPISVVTMLCSPVGIEKVLAEHPDVQIFTLSIEKGLNEKGYLLPGLGDAGDRLFGTL